MLANKLLQNVHIYGKFNLPELWRSGLSSEYLQENLRDLCCVYETPPSIYFQSRICLENIKNIELLL